MTLLRLRMTEDMQVRHFSPRTQYAYLQQVSLFARHYGQSPALLGPEQIRNYQLFLTNRKKMAPSSITVAISALRFLYQVTLKRGWDLGQSIPYPKQPRKLPVVASPEEVLHFLDCAPGLKHRAILTACYAAGLRVSEAVSLRPADIDSRRRVIRIHQGKGRKDRYLMLSPRLLAVLRDYWLSCVTTGAPSVPPVASGSSRGSHPYTPFPPRRWCAPATKPFACPACPNPSRPTHCDTASPFTCSKPAPTSAPFNSCSVIAASPPPPAPCTLPPSKSPLRPVHSTCRNPLSPPGDPPQS